MHNTKEEIRRSILIKRDALPINERSQKDSSIFKSLTENSFYRDANSIFIFVSFGSEVDTHEIIKKALKDGKTVAVPKVKSKEYGMEIYCIKSLKNLTKGYYGVLEPSDESEKMTGEELDLIIIPGVGFDRSGGRVGYGGGFYDRFLQSLKKKMTNIAIAYELQLVDELPLELHDEKIAALITEKNIYYFDK